MDITDAELIEIVRFFSSRGVKLEGYKPDFLKRRIGSRMAFTKSSTPKEYLDRLIRDDTEAKALLDSISINVSEFYRDPPVWEGIRKALRERLKEKVESGLQPTLRIWSAGCSCGEEPYTAAMVALEAMEESGIKKGRPIVIATDVDRDALVKGSTGIYSQAAIKKLPPTMLKKYFNSFQNTNDEAIHLTLPSSEEIKNADTATDKLNTQQFGRTYSVKEEIKNTVRFRIHDLFKDPAMPFMDLILCRNVLIYASSEMQKEILEKLALAVVQGGFIVLGMNEVMLTSNGLLEPYDTRLRIYRRGQKTPQFSAVSRRI